MDSGPLFDDGEQRLPDGILIAGAEVLGEMARGGMAIVYRARFEGKDVALKVGTAATQNRQAEARFRNEWQLGASLEHPNIVRPLAVGRLDAPHGFEGRMFLITELVEAQSLADLMMHNAEGVPTGRLLVVARQLSSALMALHERGIVHRDIKPDNILVDDGDGVHVIDFGLAYALGDDDRQQRTDDLTIEGEAPGTPLYMSPQQAMHLEPSRAFDIYSFGVVLYEMCCGAAPHAHLPRHQVAAARLDPNEKPISLSKMAPESPAELVKMIERCLAIEPDDRPGAGELLEFFEGGDLEERSTAPELRVVKALAEEPEVALASLTALGARPAGDETVAKLRKDNVALPSVEKNREVEPKSMAVLAEPGAESPPSSVEGDGGSALGSRRWWIVIAVLAAVVAVGLVWGGEPEVVEEAPRQAPSARGLGAIVPPSEPDLGGVEVEDSASEPEQPAPDPEPEPDSPTEIEAEPTIEVVPPARQPNGPRKGRKKRRAPQLPKVNDERPQDSPVCKKVRAAAVRADGQGAAKAVLRETRDRSCWKGSEENRRFLRANAFLDLHDYKACFDAARNGASAETKAFARMCQSKLQESP